MNEWVLGIDGEIGLLQWKAKYWKKNLSQCYFAHHQSHVDWSGIYPNHFISIWFIYIYIYMCVCVCLCARACMYVYIYIYTGCPRRNVPDFRRVFLMLKYTDKTQNTYIQSWTVTEIMAREKWGLLAVPNTATCTADMSRDSANVLDSGMQCSLCLRDALRSQPCYVTAGLSHV